MGGGTRAATAGAPQSSSFFWRHAALARLRHCYPHLCRCRLCPRRPHQAVSRPLIAEQQIEGRSMAILYVVWGVGLLAMIAVSFLSTGNVSYALSRTSLDSAQQQAAAEAGLARAVLGLLDPRPEGRWRVDGVAQPFVLGRTKMRIT